MFALTAQGDLLRVLLRWCHTANLVNAANRAHSCPKTLLKCHIMVWKYTFWGDLFMPSWFIYPNPNPRLKWEGPIVTTSLSVQKLGWTIQSWNNPINTEEKRFQKITPQSSNPIWNRRVNCLLMEWYDLFFSSVSNSVPHPQVVRRVVFPSCPTYEAVRGELQRCFHHCRHIRYVPTARLSDKYCAQELYRNCFSGPM